jgi:hypothetical protein
MIAIKCRIDVGTLRKGYEIRWTEFHGFQCALAVKIALPSFVADVRHDVVVLTRAFFVCYRLDIVQPVLLNPYGCKASALHGPMGFWYWA